MFLIKVIVLLPNISNLSIENLMGALNFKLDMGYICTPVGQFFERPCCVRDCFNLAWQAGKVAGIGSWGGR